MSSGYWQPPGLQLTPRPSLHLGLLLALCWCLALFALWHSALHWTFCLAASLALPWLALKSCSRGSVGLAAGVQTLYCSAGRWRARLPGGDLVELHPLTSSVVLPRLVVLRAAIGSAETTATLVLCADSCSARRWRHLQINLRQSLAGEPG